MANDWSPEQPRMKSNLMAEKRSRKNGEIIMKGNTQQHRVFAKMECDLNRKLNLNKWPLGLELAPGTSFWVSSVLLFFFYTLIFNSFLTTSLLFYVPVPLDFARWTLHWAQRRPTADSPQQTTATSPTRTVRCLKEPVSLNGIQIHEKQQYEDNDKAVYLIHLFLTWLRA